MFKHIRVTGVVVSTAAVMLAASPSLAAIRDCSKLINAEVIRIQSTFAKAFASCNDLYRRDAAAKVPASPAFSQAASGCQNRLDKAFAKFTAETGKLGAQGGAGKTCTDGHLIALGHLQPTGIFGARWAKTQGVGALQSAYEQALQGAKDWGNMLITMGGTGGCATCAKLATPPCSETACKLAAASQASVDLAGYLNTPTIQVPLSGSTVLKVCDMSTLISSTAGVLYVIGGPGKILDPAPVGAISTFCMATIASEGLILCSGGPPKINYTACIDHDARVSNKAGEKTAGTCTGDGCTASTADVQDPRIINGGICRTLTSTAGSAGDAFINMVWRIEQHDGSSDCLDPSFPGVLQNTPLTTGTAQATVMNADYGSRTAASSNPITGSVFDCTTLKRGASGPVKLVGAFPGVNTLEFNGGFYPTLYDGVIGFTLQCE
jgi:hypothetical protein